MASSGEACQGGDRDADTTTAQEQPGSSLQSDPPSSSTALNADLLKDRKLKKKYMLKKLDKKLEVLDRQIKKFNEADLSLDEMKSGSSVYMKEDLLKRKFVATWEELCRLQGISADIEIVEEDGTEYSETDYPQINRRVQRLLHLDEFPDHFDIVQLIERCDAKHDLHISSEEKTQLSKLVFKSVGKILKRRRLRDYRAHFGSHLTDSINFEEDPALSSDELLEALKASLRQGQGKMEEVCEAFVTKQELEGVNCSSPEGDETVSSDGHRTGEEEGEGEEEDSESEDVELADSNDEDVAPPPPKKQRTGNDDGPNTKETSPEIEDDPNGCDAATSFPDTTAQCPSTEPEVTSSSVTASANGVVAEDDNPAKPSGSSSSSSGRNSPDASSMKHSEEDSNDDSIVVVISSEDEVVVISD